MFSTLSKKGIIILAKLYLSSANALNLVQPKILSFGKELNQFDPGNLIPWFVYLNSLPEDLFLALSKLKAFADDKFNVTQSTTFVFLRAENIVGKGENAGYRHFLLFSQCFKGSFFLWGEKMALCIKRLAFSKQRILYCSKFKESADDKSESSTNGTELLNKIETL